MLRLTARHADAWNTAWYGVPDERLQENLAKLDAALEAEGRDPATLSRTVGLSVHDPDHETPEDEDDDKSFRGSVDELARVFDAYEALGIDHLILVLQPMTEASIDRLAQALRLRSGSV